MGKAIRLTVAAFAASALVLAACSNDDDGASVRTVADCGSASASAPVDSGSAAAAESASKDKDCPSGSGSATGLSQDDLGSGSDDPVLNAAVTQYRTYVDEQVDATIAATKTFTDAVRAGDTEAAKAAFAPSRQGWEAIEPIAGLVEEIDGSVDARVDDFEGVDDPTFTGWHRIEYLLWEKNDPAAAVSFADKLDADLQTLKSEVAKIEVTPLAMARGSAELVEEVSQGKITGEEDRYSGTDLWDFGANIAGAEKAIELLTPALQTADPDLLAEVQSDFAAVDTGLAKYRNADGSYQPYAALTEADKTQLKTDLAALSENLALVPGALGLS